MNGSSMKLGQYIEAESLIHKLDPRCKIASLIIVMSAIFGADCFASLIALFIATCAVTHLSSVPFRSVIRSVKPVFVLVIITSLIHLFGTDGEKIISLGKIGITSEGAVLAVKMAMKLILLVVSASFLVLTTNPSKLTDGIEGLLSPLRRTGFPAHEFAMMMTIALRFIPALFEETERIVDSQSSRGADFTRGGLLARTKAFIPVLIPVFVLVFRRADRLATAMEARGYSGGEGRTRMCPLVWKRKDTIFLAATVLYTVLIILLNGAE